MLPPIKKNSGFSLIELLVAVAIFAGISLVGVQLLWDTLTTRSKQYAIEGSSDNVRLLVSTLTRSIQSAKNVNVLDAWTVQITGNPCRTILLDNNEKIVEAIDANDPCSPPAAGSGSFNPVTKEEILIKNKQTNLPLFSPVGSFSKVITIEMNGIYKDSLGEHPFNFKTTITPRITI